MAHITVNTSIVFQIMLSLQTSERKCQTAAGMLVTVGMALVVGGVGTGHWVTVRIGQLSANKGLFDCIDTSCSGWIRK